MRARPAPAMKQAVTGSRRRMGRMEGFITWQLQSFGELSDWVWELADRAPPKPADELVGEFFSARPSSDDLVLVRACWRCNMCMLRICARQLAQQTRPTGEFHLLVHH